MPELPEVEVTCQGIRPAIIGQSIQKIIVRQHQLRWPIPKSLQTLKNTEIIGVSRRAKYILLKTASGTIIIHLGMSGRLGIVDKNTVPKKHDHVDIHLQNNFMLRYTDPRRFGAILWTSKDPQEYSLLANLGPEPLVKEFNAKYLFAMIKKRNIPIKGLIMDQKVVVGVGNIYAAEALFAAGISPLRSAASLSLTECNNLIQQIQKILQQAIQKGGTTLKDFLSPKGKRGYFVQKLMVYGREGKSCFQCNTILQTAKIAQRSSVYCQICQH